MRAAQTLNGLKSIKILKSIKTTILAGFDFILKIQARISEAATGGFL